MKLVYLAFVSPTAFGVREKIRSQIDSAASVYTSVEVINDKSRCILLRFIFRYIALCQIFINRDRNTVYYVRQQAMLPFFSYFLKGKCYAYEVNAYLPAELRTFNFLKRVIILLFNDDTKMLRGAKLQIYISSELRALYGLHCRHSMVVPNSITRLPKPLKKTERARKKIVFVGNEAQAWQGVDLLKSIINKCENFNFVLIGNFKNLPASKNVDFLGYVAPSNLPSILADCDLGISSLGFSRSGLREASPLKSRLYIECNLPHIGGYIDSEFQDYPFYKRIVNIEGLTSTQLSEVFNDMIQNLPSNFSLDDYLLRKKELEKFKKLEQISNENSFDRQ